MFHRSLRLRFLKVLRRFRPSPDRTKRTDYAQASNDTAIENLAKAIDQMRHPRRKKPTVIETCLRASFRLQPNEEAPRALKNVLEKLEQTPIDRKD